MFDLNTLEYNAYDVVNTWEVNDEVSALMLPEYEFQYKLATDMIEPLMFMMTRGVRVDQEFLKQTREEANKRLDEKRLALNEMAGRELNANSSKQLQQYFYIEKGIKPYTKRNSKGGTSITLDDKALQRIARGTATRKPYPEAKLIQEIRGLVKLIGTYLDIDFDVDNRFRCEYKPVGTKFGRLSSGKTIFETGMNMQNLPAEFKNFLVADEGFMLAEIDKAKAEWVVVAYLSGDPNMIKVIEEGLDPHVHTAHLMTDMPKEFIEMEDKVVGHTSDPDLIGEARNRIRRGSPADAKILDNADFLPRTMSVRQCGKKSNHGLNYDEGFRTFALTNEMLEAEAKKVINLYKHVAYPGIPLWHKAVQDKLAKDRTLQNCFGRTYKFLDAWGTDLFKAAYSFQPQSTVADLVNMGIRDTYYDKLPQTDELELLGQVHDSVLSQHPTDNFYNMAYSLQYMGDRMDQEMEYGARKFRIDNDLKVGPTWGNMKEVDLNLPTDQMALKLEEVHNEFKS